MVIFGGFKFGERTNDMYIFSFKNKTWKKIEPAGYKVPSPRVGHSAAIGYDPQNGDCMYVFGGKDDDNNKLNDVWKFNFQSREWTEIVAVHEPRPRSGHSACIYKDRYMIIYGGIEEITKELNDMHIFDCRAEKWMVLFEEINSPKKARVD